MRAHYKNKGTSFPVPTYCFSFIRKVLQLRKKGRGRVLKTDALKQNPRKQDPVQASSIL